MKKSLNSIKQGDIFKLGNHYIGCGDSRDKDFVEKVIGKLRIKAVISDPPYGVAVTESKKNFKTLLKDKKVENDHIQSDKEYPVEGLRPLGDKRTRVALISHHIKNGTIQFAPRGNEELVMQLVNFGSENYMDLADALSMVVPELVNTQQGYHPFPDQNSHRVEKGEEDECDFDPITGRYIDRSKPITAGFRKMKF